MAAVLAGHVALFLAHLVIVLVQGGRLTLAQATSQFEIPRPAPGRIPHTRLKVGLRREGDLRGRHLQAPLDANGAEIRGGA